MVVHCSELLSYYGVDNAFNMSTRIPKGPRGEDKRLIHVNSLDWVVSECFS